MEPYRFASSASQPEVLLQSNRIVLECSPHPVTEYSLQVRDQEGRTFCEWGTDQYTGMYNCLQAITTFWKEKLVATQYLVYAKQEFEKNGDAKPFAGWEIIPYKTIESASSFEIEGASSSEDEGVDPSEITAVDSIKNKAVLFFDKIVTVISRIWQQCVVFYRIIFGAAPISKRELSLKETFYYQLKPEYQYADYYARGIPRSLSPQSYEMEDVEDIQVDEGTQSEATDPFCKQEVRDKQRVWGGQYGDGLVSYAPVGLGGERIHLLYVPRAHGDFDTLSEKAHNEAMHFHNASIKVIVRNRQYTDRAIQNVYMMHKKGQDAGQTVMGHWHSQCIMTSAGTQDTLSKLQVLWNILFGSSKLKENELNDYVEKFRGELSEIPQLGQAGTSSSYGHGEGGGASGFSWVRRRESSSSSSS